MSSKCVVQSYTVTEHFNLLLLHSSIQHGFQFCFSFSLLINFLHFKYLSQAAQCLFIVPVKSGELIPCKQQTSILMTCVCVISFLLSLLGTDRKEKPVLNTRQVQSYSCQYRRDSESQISLRRLLLTEVPVESGASLFSPPSCKLANIYYFINIPQVC